MRLKIRTYVLSSVAALIALLGLVAVVALDRTAAMGQLASIANGRVVDETRIADAILDLGQQMRFVDGLIVQSKDAGEDALARSIIGDRLAAIAAQTASYQRYVDSPLQHHLLLNLQSARDAYLGLQQAILARAPAERAAGEAENGARLTAAFDAMNRQARGLVHVAEADAREARADAQRLMAEARKTVLTVAGLAGAVAVVVLAVLFAFVFRPLARINAALNDLAKGKMDVSLELSGQGGEVEAMAQALDMFRNNAVALARAHDEVKAAHSRADALARHDALTGLPNRRVLTGAIGEMIGRASRAGTGFAVLVLDLDRFKPVNDLCGHGAGDRVLCEVAARLGAGLASTDLAARLGGDEFALVVECEPGSDTALRTARRLAASVGQPIAVEGRSVTVGSSIGIAVWPSDGADAEALLHAADLAMFNAKREGRGTFRFFEPELDIQLRARADLEGRIAEAIASGAIRPHYQPLVNLRHNTIFGFEVLARWHDGDLVRQPGEFIPVAEEAGLLPALTDAVMRRACRDARGWLGEPMLSVNVSPAQIADPTLPATILGLLAEEGFPPHRIELEVTENALIGDISVAKSVIGELRASGVRVSLDDFGTGYSSLHHLRDLHFDRIKIDRSFVQSMMTNAESRTIIATILGLGRSLGVFTLAEGIEESGHLQMLVDHGCEFGQGYHLGRPLLPSDVTDLLRREAAAPARLAPAA